MHRYWVLTRFYLILSILNLVLAIPIVVQRIHDAPRDDVAEDIAAMKKRLVEAVSDRSMLPRLPPDDPEPEPEPASPQHSTLSDEAVVSETDSLDSGHSWPLPLGPHLQSLHDSASLHRPSSGPPPDFPSSSRGPVSSYPSSSVSPEASQELGPERIPPWMHDPSGSWPAVIPDWVEQMQGDLPPFLHHSWLHDSTSRGPSDPGPSMIRPVPDWVEQMQEDLPPSLRHPWLHDSTSRGPSDPGPSTIQPPEPWQLWLSSSTPHLPESLDHTAHTATLLSTPTSSEPSQGFAATSRFWDLPASLRDWEFHQPSSSRPLAAHVWSDVFEAEDILPFVRTTTLSHDTGSPSVSDPGPSTTQPPDWLVETPPSPHSPSSASTAASDMPPPKWFQEYALALERKQSPPPSAESAPPPTSPHPPSSVSSETSDSDLPFLEWLQEFAHAPPHRRDCRTCTI